MSPSSKEFVEHHVRATSHIPHPVAFASLLSFLASWVFSPLLPIVSLAHTATQIANNNREPTQHIPFALTLFYYTYRHIFPASRWDAFLRLYRLSMTNSNGYFQNQILVQKGEEVKSDDSTLLAFHPHGVLCLGWTIANSSGKEGRAL